MKETYTVTKVHDGDTITVTSINYKSLTVRLNGIDAPELSQSYGKKAQKFLSDMVLNKNVSIDILGEDVYGRKIGVVYLDDINVNSELVKSGLAWWFNQYSPKDESLHLSEQYARSNKLGLWSRSSNPTPPWRWRKLEKLQQLKNDLKKPEAKRSLRENPITDEDFEVYS